MPSSLKSPVVRPQASGTVVVVCAWKVPSPLPRRRLTLAVGPLVTLFVTTRSAKESTLELMLAMATLIGRSPTV
jgi:hypothetical protein